MMTKEKKPAGSIDKKPSNSVAKAEGANRKFDDKVVDKKVVKKSLPNLVGYERGKLTPYE